MKSWYLRPQFAPRKRKLSGGSSDRNGAAVLSWDNFIEDSDVLNKLALEAQQLWNVHGGDKYKAKSLWIFKEDSPKCLLEKFALQVGVEYWVQSREGSYDDKEVKHGLEFHFDKDEISAKESDEWYHPAFSTVTYLPAPQSTERTKRSGGIPLVVFSTESLEDGQEEPKRPQQFPRCSWIIQPQPNRHVMFNGNLLHGCPKDLIEPLLGHGHGQSELGYTRLSLAVNVWTRHEPKDLQRLDVSSLTSSQSKSANKRSAAIADIAIDATDATQVKQVRVSSAMPMRNLHMLEEHREGDTAPLPIAEIRQEFLKLMNGDESSSVIAVKYYAN